MNYDEFLNDLRETADVTTHEGRFQALAAEALLAVEKLRSIANADLFDDVDIALARLYDLTQESNARARP